MSKPQAFVCILNRQFEFLNAFSKMDQTENYLGCTPPNTSWQASEAKSSALPWLIAWLKKNQNAHRKFNVVKVRRRKGLKVGNKCKDFVYKWQLECMREHAVRSVPQNRKM